MTGSATFWKPGIAGVCLFVRDQPHCETATPTNGAALMLGDKTPKTKKVAGWVGEWGAHLLGLTRGQMTASLTPPSPGKYPGYDID